MSSKPVSAERWTVYLMLSGQIMNNLAIRFGLPAMIFFMQQEYKLRSQDTRRHQNPSMLPCLSTPFSDVISPPGAGTCGRVRSSPRSPALSSPAVSPHAIFRCASEVYGMAV